MTTGRKHFQEAVSLEANLVYDASTAVAGCRVEFVANVRPVQLMPHTVVLLTLAGVSH